MAEHYAGTGREFLSAPVLGNPYRRGGGQAAHFRRWKRGGDRRVRTVFSGLSDKGLAIRAAADAPSPRSCAAICLLAGMMEAFAEAMLLAEKSGVEQKTFMEIVGASALAAPMFQAKGELIVGKDYEPTFYLRNLLKDLNLALDAAATAGVALPGVRTRRDIYDAAARGGFSELDYAAVFEWLAQQGSASSASA